MKILAIEKEISGINYEDYKPHLKNEALTAWDLYQSGKIRELYFSENDYAVLVLECINKDEAWSILSTLPLVKAGLINFDLIALKAYPGFQRLFNDDR